MSTLTAARALPGPTPYERMLLLSAAALDGYVVTRIAHRAAVAGRTRAQQRAGDARRDAQALGAVGTLPR